MVGTTQTQPASDSDYEDHELERLPSVMSLDEERDGERDTLVARDDHEPLTVIAKGNDKTLLRKLGSSFFLFGLINNVLYVIILSAALDLVPASTPKGLILLFDIFPSLIAKSFWPYLSKGQVRYGQRIFWNLAFSVGGVVIVAAFQSVGARLFGIGLTSWASGLGELTFLQLSTTYNPPSIGGKSVGYFAAGTGGAGIVGAFLWWQVRSLGVREGVGISAILPFIIPLTYYLLLPSPSAFSFSTAGSAAAYEPIPTIVVNDGEEEQEEQETFEDNRDSGPVRSTLTGKDKWRLVRPLLWTFMLPLFCVYTFEYTINQGIAPTLIYPPPSPTQHPIPSKIIHTIRDYYPLWQLIYQTSVFFSRSSISLGIPPLPYRLLWSPAIIQLCVLIVLSLESAKGIFESGVQVVGQTVDDWEGWSVFIVVVLVAVEGICGGLSYVNTFYHINQMPTQAGTDPELAKQEREFQIASIGFADSLGILCASLLAMPTELQLCNAQVRRGKMLCKAV